MNGIKVRLADLKNKVSGLKEAQKACSKPTRTARVQAASPEQVMTGYRGHRACKGTYYHTLSLTSEVKTTFVPLCTRSTRYEASRPNLDKAWHGIAFLAKLERLRGDRKFGRPKVST